MNNTISHDFIENRTVYPKIELKEDKPMTITATEFKKNLGKYLELVSKEEICITKNGNVIAVLSLPEDDSAYWESMVGALLPKDGSKGITTLEEIRDERLKKHL